MNHLEKQNVNGPVGHARRDMKLEAVVIPVSDVDRAKAFYESLGWRLDADFRFDNGFRVVQFTPPGSDASIQFGSQMTSAAPGSALVNSTRPRNDGCPSRYTCPTGR